MQEKIVIQLSYNTQVYFRFVGKTKYHSECKCGLNYSVLFLITWGLCALQFYTNNCLIVLLKRTNVEGFLIKCILEQIYYKINVD